MTDDEFLRAAAEATGKAAASAKAETGVIPTGAKYSPDAMIDLMVSHPWYTPQQFAEHFGRKKPWYYSVLASEAFQSRLSERKDEIPDPSLAASLQERFKALTLKSIDVLHARLDTKEVGDLLITKAAEIGIKALGMGQAVPPPPAAAAPATIDQLAERLTQALENQRKNSRVVAADVTDVEAKEKKSLSIPTIGMTLFELRGGKK